MPDDILLALRPLAERLGTRLPDNPALRKELATLARAFANWLDPAAVTPAVSPPPPPTAHSSTNSQPGTSGETLPPLTFHLPPPPHRPRLSESEQEQTTAKEPPASPQVIAARCRLKVDACRLLVSQGYDPSALAARELLAKSDALHNCQLWMLLPGDYNTAGPAWADLVLAYEAATLAAELLQFWYQSPPETQARIAEDVLHLVAEAQSTLLSATIGVGRWAYDQDQLEIYLIVAAETKSRRVYVRRYLRREDRADPGKAGDVKKRICEQLQLVKSSNSVAVNRKKLMSSLRFKLGKITANSQAGAEEWPLVLEILDKLVADGVPPSSPDLREPLLPVHNDLPQNLLVSKNAMMVFRELDRYEESLVAADEATESRADRWNADVDRVAELVAGRTMILIGGQVRQQRKDALIRAFRLTDLDWLSTPEHTSITFFEPYIARSETAVVLLAIRWSNHDYSEVQQYCARYNKLLVRLPAGYHPNQVAHQILSQVGDQLSTSLASSA